MILEQLLNVLKQTDPQQYAALKKECNDRKEYMDVVLGEIGEAYLEQQAEGYVEMCDKLFYDETEHFTKEQLSKMKAPYVHSDK